GSFERCWSITAHSSLTTVQASGAWTFQPASPYIVLLSQQPLDTPLKCCLRLLCGKQSFQPPQICIHRYVLIRYIDEPLNRCPDDPHLRVERKIHSAPRPLPRLIHDLYRNSSEAFKQIIKRAIERPHNFFLPTTMRYSHAHTSPFSRSLFSF